MASRLAGIILSGVVLALTTSAGVAHELSENRATLVLRDKTHLTMTLYVAYPELLFRALAPAKAFGPFLLEYSTMEPARFLQELLRAQARIEQGTQLRAEDGRPLMLEHWSWPNPATAQAMLRERVMQETLDSSGAHGKTAEIRAEAVASREIRTISIRFPTEVQGVLVVAYRPTQTWVGPGEQSAVIGF
jgi:hypothetical protein